MCPLEFTPSDSLQLKPQQSDVACFQLEKKKKKWKQINKLEYKKPHNNTIEANIKTDQEYKEGALTRTKFAWKINNKKQQLK